MKNAYLKFLAISIISLLTCNVSFAELLPVKPGRHHDKRHQNQVSIESFGAVANNPDIDNSPFIMKALTSSNDVLIPAKTYYIKHVVLLRNSNNKSITANGATVINVNYDESTLHFSGCNTIKIQGGTYTRDVLPQKQDGKGQNTFLFENCKDLTINRIHIDRSPEMGIGLGLVIGANITNNLIEHCLRDGVYAHYSANLKYIGNRLNEIKDDALSMHDYGKEAFRGPLHAAGYTQSGHSEISDNIITNSVEGIASSGCTNIVIKNNNVKNTVNAGISIFNNEALSPEGNLRVNNITIENNVLSGCDQKIVINGLTIPNVVPNSGGRAAIFIACIPAGADGNFRLSKWRLADIKVLNNIVSNSATNAITLYNIDNLTLSGNQFTDCHSNDQNSSSGIGDIAEILNCTKIDVKGNSIIDNRSNITHNYAYTINNSTGTFQKGNNRGWRKGEVNVINSSLR